jgi:hypothetical protein
VLRRQTVHRPTQLDAGPFAADVASFRLYLAAENKAPGTVRTYTEAALWFAAAHLLRRAGPASARLLSCPVQAAPGRCFADVSVPVS